VFSWQFNGITFLFALTLLLPSDDFPVEGKFPKCVASVLRFYELVRMNIKRAKQMGPALNLGSLQTPLPHFTKRECTGSHKWKTSKFNRECTRCGRREEKCNGQWISPKPK
jgi:hypothetical protein